MANEDKVLPAVKLKVGGKERELTLSLGSFVRIKKSTGLNPFDEKFSQQLDENMDPELLGNLLVAMLDKKDDPITFEEVVDSIDWRDMPKVMDAIKLAMSNGTDQAEGAEAEVKKEEAAEAPSQSQ